jgi:hypothetical protein
VSSPPWFCASSLLSLLFSRATLQLSSGFRPRRFGSHRLRLHFAGYYWTSAAVRKHADIDHQHGDGIEGFSGMSPVARISVLIGFQQTPRPTRPTHKPRQCSQYARLGPSRRRQDCPNWPPNGAGPAKLLHQLIVFKKTLIVHSMPAHRAGCRI